MTETNLGIPRAGGPDIDEYLRDLKDKRANVTNMYLSRDMLNLDLMATPAKPVEARQHFIVEVWETKRELVKILLGDSFIFLTALFVLFVMYLGFRGLEKAGYAHERLAVFETLHYWAYLIVLVMFLADLVVKLFVALFLKKKDP